MKVNESFAVEATEEQSFVGNREYDEKLLRERYDYTYENRGATYSESMNKVIDMEFLDHKYNQTELRQRIAEKESELEELKKQLKG